MNRTQTFEQFLASTSADIAIVGFIINLLLAGVLASILALVYIRYGKSLSNRHAFARNFLMLTMTVMIIISIVKSSLALSLGLVGALSIVRFRTAIKEPEELTFAFLSIAIGLGLGADQVLVTVVSFFVVVLAVMARSQFGTNDTAEFVNLRLEGRSAEMDISKISDVLSMNSQGVSLKRLDEGADNTEMLFSIVFRELGDIVSVKKQLKSLNDNMMISYFDKIGSI